MKTNNNGWVCLHRSILSWEWWDDLPTRNLFFYCLLSANHEEESWHGIQIPRGSLMTSYNALARGTGFSVKQMRRAVENLKKTGELGIKRAGNGAILTINNYGKYQDYTNGQGQTLGSSRADLGQTLGRLRATNNNNNNITSKQYNNNNISSIDIDDMSGNDPDNVDYAGIVKFWNYTTQGRYGELRSIDNTRRKLTRARIRQYGKQTFADAIKKVASAKWFEDKTWFNYDWLIRPNNFDKVISGNYDDKTAMPQITANLTYTTNDASGKLVLCYNDVSGNPVIIPFDAPPRPNAHCDYDFINKRWIDR